MGSSILQLAQDVADDPGVALSRPDSLFPSDDDGDDTYKKLKRAITKSVKLIAAIHDWQILKAEFTFISVAAEIQTNAIPDDFARFVFKTFWDRSTRMPITGPLSSSDWAEQKARMLATVTPQFRQMGDEIHFFPAPPAGHTCAYEYIRNVIGYSKDNSNNKIKVSRFAKNEDTTFWDDELVTLGAVMNYRQGIGQSFEQQFNDFQLSIADWIKMDGGQDVIDMTGKGSLKDANDLLAMMKSNAIAVP